MTTDSYGYEGTALIFLGTHDGVNIMPAFGQWLNRTTGLVRMDLSMVNHESSAEATFKEGVITWSSTGNTWNEQTEANFDNVTVNETWHGSL